TAEHDEF
nr:Chain B, THR-ALA-GLU-HIS-ASP-GLU-PHE [Homo sapiens]